MPVTVVASSNTRPRSRPQSSSISSESSPTLLFRFTLYTCFRWDTVEEKSVYCVYIQVSHGVAAWDKVGSATFCRFSFRPDFWEASWETVRWGEKRNEEVEDQEASLTMWKNLCKPTWNTDIRIRLWLQAGRLMKFEAMDLGEEVVCFRDHTMLGQQHWNGSNSMVSCSTYLILNKIEVD